MVEAVADQSTDEPQTRADADVWLRETARKTVRAHLQIREDAEWAAMVKSMTEQTQREYTGRFLFELLQNAYDRHSAGTIDGRVAIILRPDEGPHGTLYVANTGLGFAKSNVRRIASLGLSDKLVGEGIGNKGVGFKSVLQICETPEIYSTLSHGAPGFCFRFAADDDIPDLVDGDPVAAGYVRDEVSMYNLTLPVAEARPEITELWTEGFVTVVRLPLVPDALLTVQNAILELESSDVPVLLFLDRLCQVEIRRADDATKNFTLTRHIEATLHPAAAFRSHIVNLVDEGTFLVLSRTVDPPSVRHVLSEAVATGKLDKRWAEWTSPVEVSIALHRGAADATPGRFYTFLPMGEKAPSPLAGHVNGPFFANFARTDVPTDHPLNALLLREIAGLCLSAAHALAGGGEPEVADDVLDLITWNSAYLPVLIDEAARSGQRLEDRPVIPTREPGSWTTVGDAWTWPSDNTAVLTAGRVGRLCHLHFLPALAEGRDRRLRALISALDLNAEPDDQTLAEWIERTLADMLAAKAPISEWESAYSDLAKLFATTPDVLRSRNILLTEDWQLRPCAAAAVRSAASSVREVTPFFPPVRQRTDDEDDVDPDTDLDLPRSLSQRIYYLHPDLTWYDNRRQQTSARRFLQEKGLVRRFDSRSILEHIRGLLAGRRKVADSTARDALTLTYNLTRSGSFGRVDLAELGLLVPTIHGTWVPARSALFSTMWPGTNGDDLSTIASTSEERSSELSVLGNFLLARPEQLVRQSGDLQAWTRFLGDIGVRDVLELRQVRDGRRPDGSDLTRGVLANVTGVPEAVKTVWQARLPQRSAASYPQTPYKAKSPLYWLPGQGDWDRLTERVRKALVRQIALGLKGGGWPEEALTTAWVKDRQYQPDECEIHTPLYAFLATASWIQVQRPGQSGVEYRRPAECWTYPSRTDRNDDGPPRFAPLVASGLRALLNDDATAMTRLRDLGMGIWGSSDDAPRLVRYLGRLVANDVVTEVHMPQFLATYRAAWLACAASSLHPFAKNVKAELVVDIGGTITALTVEPEDGGEEFPELVVASVDDKSLLRLLADFRRPVLVVDRRREQVVDLLRQGVNARVVASTQVAPTVLTDGAPFDPATASGSAPLVDLVPQLPVLVGTLLEYRRSSFDRGGQRAFDDALDVLRRVRIVYASVVEVRLGDDVRPLPHRLNGVLSVADAETPTLVLQHSAGQLDWQVIESLAEPLMYLVGRPNFTDALRLAAARLRAVNAPLDGVAVDDLASACGVENADVSSTTRRVETAWAPLLARLYPVVAHFVGTAAATGMDPDAGTIGSESDVREALESLGASLPKTPADILEAARNASSIDELRLVLGVALGEMNATLIALGRPYEPIDYGARHADDFADHLRACRDRVTDRIRWKRWPFFAAFAPQPDWVQLRRPDVITPDPSWARTLDEVTLDQMDERVETELLRLLGSTPPQDGPPLRSIAECAKANKELITPRVGHMSDVVRAWLAKRHRQLQPPWDAPDTAGRALLEALDGSGAMDFAELSFNDVLRWLAVLGIWPASMPESDDLAELDLTDKDLDAERASERRRRDEAARKRRTLTVDDTAYDLDGGLVRFSSLLSASLSQTPGFLATSNRPSRLKAIGPPGSSRGGSGGGAGGSGGGSDRGLTDTQRAAVGFAGEWFAYQWLAKVHGSDLTPECWVSAYREEMYSGAGDDGLGWDFAVPASNKGGTRYQYYEVKTTTTDGGQLELGETQVRAAQQFARNESWRLLVITNVLSYQRRLHVLRNPFHQKSRGLYDFVGQGLRLRYELT